jgi:hypothetical protein
MFHTWSLDLNRDNSETDRLKYVRFFCNLNYTFTVEEAVGNRLIFLIKSEIFSCIFRL